MDNSKAGGHEHVQGGLVDLKVQCKWGGVLTCPPRQAFICLGAVLAYRSPVQTAAPPSQRFHFSESTRRNSDDVIFHKAKCVQF